MSSINRRTLAPSDRPATRVLWLPFDDAELAELLRGGWREVHRELFGSRIRVEITNAPLPQAPAAEPESFGEKVRRNHSHSGPRGAFRRVARGRAWTE